MKKSKIKGNLSGDAKKWAEDIFKWRIKFGYTQEELAELVGLGPKAVGDWERDGKMPHKTTRKILSSIFNANVTSKGIIENDIPMKVNEESNIPEEKPDQKDWYKKTIDNLIHTNGEAVRLNNETIRELKNRDRDEIEYIRIEKTKLIDVLVSHFKPPQNGQ